MTVVICFILVCHVGIEEADLPSSGPGNDILAADDLFGNRLGERS